MDISALDKGAVLAALFNHAKPLGMGYIHYQPLHVMTPQEGNALLAEGTYYDYLEGRVMKVDLGKPNLDTALYNRDNGPGAAEAAIATLK